MFAQASDEEGILEGKILSIINLKIRQSINKRAYQKEMCRQQEELRLSGVENYWAYFMSLILNGKNKLMSSIF